MALSHLDAAKRGFKDILRHDLNTWTRGEIKEKSDQICSPESVFCKGGARLVASHVFI